MSRIFVGLHVGFFLFVSAAPVLAREADTLVRQAYAASYRYETAGNYKDAFRALFPVYKQYPSSYTVNLRFGWLNYLMKNHADAAAYYQTAEKALPTSLEPKLGLAAVYLAQEEWEKAEEKCNEILKTDYYNYYGNLRLALALQGQKKYAQAESVARKMLAILPTDVTFLNTLAVNLYLQGKYEEAYSLFYNVTILDPENITAKGYLGIR